MPVQGYFTFVLHSHIPYVRAAGRWPFGEETLHEAIAETYVPLLNALYDLVDAGMQPRLTIGITPILLEQIADADVAAHFELYVQEKMALAEADIARFAQEGNERFAGLARFYHDWYSNVLQSFQERYGSDLVGAFRRLQDGGYLDILTSAATHGYLPLMERDSTIYGQLKVGRDASARRFGRAPRGVWLPECGYRPAYYTSTGQPYLKPGVEDFLADLELGYFFTDTQVIEGGRLTGKAVGDVIGPYGGLPIRKLVQVPITEPTEKTTFRPYFVTTPKVAVYGRDERTGMQVWSAAQGYPGDFVYREFHRKDDHSGLQYWRVSGAGVDLGQKDLYDPGLALQQVGRHAQHFAGLVVERLAGYYAAHQKPGIIASAYDTELFGHWWFEGIIWIKEVLRALAASETVKLTTANGYLEQFPPTEVLALRESSWGAGGGHWTWLNPGTEWMWPLIHNAERQMEKLVARYPDAQGDLLAVLNQVARELVLLESSDWPFLISTGQAKDYASGRFQQHLARFNRLVAVAEAGVVSEGDRRTLATILEYDNPFPAMDYRLFANREGRKG